MENEQQNSGGGGTQGESLEGPNVADTPAQNTDNKAGGDADKPKKKKGGGLFGKFSVYLLMFVLVILLAFMVVVGTYLHSKSKSNTKINTQNLTQSDLSQLAQSDVTVGDSKQVLNVQSNAVFAGQVLVRSDLQVAGKLQVGGSLSLAGITVSGDSIVDQLQVNKNIQVAGDASVAGQLTVTKNISVNGTGTFNGALSAPSIIVNQLQMNGDFSLTHHIIAGGANPGRSTGNALGGGGTASVGGSDTAGSITVNTGSNPSVGCFITVNFANRFSSTPHIVVSPVGAAAGGLGYYITKNTTGFTVCSTNAPPASQSFGFDYIVFD